MCTSSYQKKKSVKFQINPIKDVGGKISDRRKDGRTNGWTRIPPPTSGDNCPNSFNQETSLETPLCALPIELGGRQTVC